MGRSSTEELVLKLVKSQATFPGVPTEAENFIKISREHPCIADDASVAFPRQIVRLLGSRRNLRYDVIVMRKAVGRGLGQVIQEKWRAGRVSELMAILEKAGQCLGEFHQRYGGKQHNDLTPTNILFDETCQRVTFIDVGGMGTSTSESDIGYFSKCLSLSARLVGHQLEVQGVQHFRQGYAKATRGSMKGGNPICSGRTLANHPKSIVAPLCYGAHVRSNTSRTVSSTASTSYPTLLGTPRNPLAHSINPQMITVR